jgi:uncharacterized membrane protein YkoI
LSANLLARLINQTKIENMKHYKIIATLTLIGALAVGCESEKEDDSAALASQAKISKEDATKTALAKVPNGTIKEAELEKEKGKLIWSFDMSTPDTQNTTEVNVDAITGDIVNVEIEKPGDEAKEADEKDEKK